MKDCPKCGKEGLEPTWHKDDSKCKEKDSFNILGAEHLHYYCKCGYDFIRELKRFT